MMIHLIICFLLFFAPSPAVVTGRNLLNSTTDLHHQYPINFEYVDQRRILASTFSSNVEPNAQSPCLTGNPIDDCWQCDPNWASDRQRLADCAIGFGHFATGGKGGNIYVVTDLSDDYVVDPEPGTLRHALIQVEPLWIIFSADMKMIKLSHELIVGSFKTIDGRGANISITGKGCITLHNVTNVIIHNIRVYGCVPSESADIRSSPTKIEHREKSEGDGISIIGSQNIWIDHCTISHCTDGLIDATLGSTAITISNNHFSDHESVMLLGHNDNYTLDKGMQVTIAFNHFGEQLTKNMPLCRHGYFHIVNNDYTGWKTFAIGGSANPTIISQGNRYTAPNDSSSKQVTARLDTDEKVWVKWDWRSDFDLMVNGAYFVTTRQPLNVNVSINASTHVDPKSVDSVGKLTETAGVILGQRNDTQDRVSNGGGGGANTGNSGTGTLTYFGSSGETVGSADGTHTDNFGSVLLKILGILATFLTAGGLGYKCFFCNRVVNN